MIRGYKKRDPPMCFALGGDIHSCLGCVCVNVSFNVYLLVDWCCDCIA